MSEKLQRRITHLTRRKKVLTRWLMVFRLYAAVVCGYLVSLGLSDLLNQPGTPMMLTMGVCTIIAFVLLRMVGL